MPKFIFNKLVRDGLPKMYDELGQVIVFRRLAGVAYLGALRDKVVEEVSEIPIASSEREVMIDEISDAEQGLDDLKRALGISDEEVVAAKARKFAKKGGFGDGVFVDSIELADDDKWVEYYRREPEKYEEIES